MTTAIAWKLADDSTEILTAQRLEALTTRDTVLRLSNRYRNCDNASRAGHLFEVMHALSFNQDAIAQRQTVRALVTEWVGSGVHSASDVNLIDGRRVFKAQAKVYASVSGMTHQLSRPHYRGMQRLVPSDRHAAVQSLLIRKAAMQPNASNHARFQDVRRHLTDVLHHGNVQSVRVGYEQAQLAARNPMRWINGQVSVVVAKELAVGARAAAGTDAVLHVMTNAPRLFKDVRAGKLGRRQATTELCTGAGRAGARSGLVWAASSAGQVAIPVPVLGILIGGMVGTQLAKSI